MRSITVFEQVVVQKLKEKYGLSNNKREHDQDNGESESRKRLRIAMKVREHPAVCPENQPLVDAFVEFGEAQVAANHRSQGVFHLRAARAFCNYDRVIASKKDAKRIDFIGEKMARHVEQVLQHGKIIDNPEDVDFTSDHEKLETIRGHDIRSTPVRCPENTKLVEAMTDYAEHAIESGDRGTGGVYLRAASVLHDTDIVVNSGSQAAQEIDMIGHVIGDSIDEILKYGRVIRDSHHATNVRIPPIVQDLRKTPAKVSENQKIVDALLDYGYAHLQSGHRGKGISHLRAAKEIRNSEIMIRNATDAMNIPMVGTHVVNKVEQILSHGHADSDEDYEQSEEEEKDGEDVDGEYGEVYDTHHTPSLVQEVRSFLAVCPENQKIVDALSNFGEKRLHAKDTGRGVTYLRAARQLRDTQQVITSGEQAKSIGMIGNKVASLIEEILSSSGT